MSVIRKIAAEIAHDALFGDIDAEATVEAVLRRIRPGGQELMFFRELAVGTVRRAITLDAIIAACSPVGLSEIEPRVLSALRVGAYELTFMEKESPCAAIDVMARTARYWSTRSYDYVRETLNAIAASAGPFLREKPRKADRRCVLQVGPSLWRVFKRRIFPDPRSSRGDYLSAIHSLPSWLVRRLAGQHGNSVERIAAALNSAPRNVLFANTLRNDTSQLADALAKQGLATEPGRSRDTLLSREDVNIESMPAYIHGRFGIADEFDIGAADFLRARLGERVCILRARACTMARIALAAGPESEVTVCAADENEAGLLAMEAARLGLRNTGIVVLDAYNAASVLDASYDRVFVEPPGSETGRMRRSAAARWRMKEKMLARLSQGQKSLLAAAIELCAAGGVTVYVTGSLLREENRDIVESVAEPLPHLKIADRSVLLPAVGGPEGGFRAKIIKFSTL